MEVSEVSIQCPKCRGGYWQINADMAPVENISRCWHCSHVFTFKAYAERDGVRVRINPGPERMPAWGARHPH